MLLCDLFNYLFLIYILKLVLSINSFVIDLSEFFEKIKEKNFDICLKFNFIIFVKFIEI